MEHIIGVLAGIVLILIPLLRNQKLTDQEKGRRRLLRQNPHLWKAVGKRAFTGRPVSHLKV